MPVTINGTTGIVSPNYTGNGSVPTGSVYHFASSTAPTGFLICNGDAVPNGSGTVQGVTTDFSALYAILGTTYGVAGTLPDLRGYFVRGAGTNSDGTVSGAFGNKQGDLIKNHTHSYTVYYDRNDTAYSGSIGGGLYGSRTTSGTTGGVTGGTETRPANIALLPCIKY
jgi:microcystin-dependent protein